MFIFKRVSGCLLSKHFLYSKHHNIPCEKSKFTPFFRTRLIIAKVWKTGWFQTKSSKWGIAYARLWQEITAAVKWGGLHSSEYCWDSDHCAFHQSTQHHTAVASKACWAKRRGLDLSLESSTWKPEGNGFRESGHKMNPLNGSMKETVSEKVALKWPLFRVVFNLLFCLLYVKR